MAHVVVLTNFRQRFWNIGDTVELFGDELKKQLEAGNVELVKDESEAEEVIVKPKLESYVCGLCGKEAKSEFGLMAHQRTHRKVEVKK